jgi:chromosome segregation ATPase
MSDVLLIVILLVSTATSTLTIRVLRSSRRSERFGEANHEFLLNQQEQLRLLREGQEHQRLIEELEKERKERLATQQQLERLEQHLSVREQQLLEREQKERLATQQHQRLVEELEREREARLETQQQLERLEQHLSVREQEEQRLATQQQLERLEQQLLPLEQERQRLEEELSELQQLPGKHQAELLGTHRSWRRRPIGVVLLLLGTAVLWLVSLVVALYLLNA